MTHFVPFYVLHHRDQTIYSFISKLTY